MALLTEKAFLEIEGTAETIPCMFNPSELAVSRSNSWSGNSLAGQGVPQLHYQGASSGSMSLELTFDTTDTGQAVTTYTGKVLALMDVDSSLAGHGCAVQQCPSAVRRLPLGQPAFLQSRGRQHQPAIHLFLVDGCPAAGEGLADADPVPGVERLRPAEPDVGYAETTPGAPGAARRDPRSDLGEVLRRFDPVAADRLGQRHFRPVGHPQRCPAVNPAGCSSDSAADGGDRPRGAGQRQWRCRPPCSNNSPDCG